MFLHIGRDEFKLNFKAFNENLNKSKILMK